MSKELSLGVINHHNSDRRTDYLYRISIKGLIKNAAGEVLVVKESGRDWWDLPGGGMDHGEDLKKTIAREMKEEVSLQGEFDYRVIGVDGPDYLAMHDFWQVRLIFEIIPTNMTFGPGEDGDEVTFMDPKTFRASAKEAERRIYQFACQDTD